jgi:hypothetical protein
MRVSDEMQVLIDPVGAYRRAAAGPLAAGWAVGRPLLISCGLGAATSVMGTGLITPALFLGGAACWAFVPIIQGLTGLVLVAGAPVVPWRRGLALLFLGHAPWTLWLLTFAGAMLAGRPLGLLTLMLTAILPLVATVRTLDAFCREVLHLSPSVARRRVLVHQAITWTIVLAYADEATQFLPRVIGVFQQ